MSKIIRSKLQREVEAELRATGLPWCIEVGRKHRLVILNGRQIGAISDGSPRGADGKNVISVIRREAKRAREQA